MTKRIFRSIFLVSLAVLVTSLALILGAVHTHFTQIQMDQLKIETALAAKAAANEGIPYFDGLDTLSCRITWIDSTGAVLYDNRSDSQAMTSHLLRQEVEDALAYGSGESVRYSDTLMERYIYYAQRLPDGTVLRLSTSQSSLLSLALSMSGYILAVVAIISLLSLLLSRRMARNLVQPLNNLNLDEPMSNKSCEEIQPLLQRLESQQNQLRGQAMELAHKQKEFNTVTRSLSEGLVLLNTSGTILSINPAAAKLLEVTQNCLGADFSVANRNQAIAALVELALAGENAQQTVDLTSGTYLAAASPVRSEGSVFGVVLLLFDVTQKQRAEQLRREFTANVSHELKTPLHAISGYAELMKDGIVAPEDLPAFSEKIYLEAQRLMHLVEDTLRLSRLDEGAEDMQWSQVDLLACVKSAQLELAGPAELGHVRLTVDGSCCPISSIPQLVGAIVFNLMDNAVKYTPAGGQVTVTVDELPEAVRLTVADTGIGIPPEETQRIFERFYRVDKSRSKAAGGTGLGLSIVKHAAAIVHGQIQLDSVLGKGTTISVTFPK